MQAFSQPNPEDVFGTPQVTPASTNDSQATPGAVDVLYSRGDAVWYRQTDGTEVPATVVAVDMAVYPPSYGVKIGDNIRETEASRLKTRGSAKTLPTQFQNFVSPAKPHASSQYIPDHELQPPSSGASFGSFEDAPETFAYPDPRQPHSPSHHHPAHVNTAAAAAAAYARQAFQPDSDMPWGHSNGAAHMPYPNEAVGHIPGSFQGHAQDILEDDGFGDFAAAEDAPEQAAHSAAGQQSSQPVKDRSAPLSLSLFGEDSATSFSTELPVSMQLGQAWSPDWWTSSPSSMQPHLMNPSDQQNASQQQGTLPHQTAQQQQRSQPPGTAQQQHGQQSQGFVQQQSPGLASSFPQALSRVAAQGQGTTENSLTGASPNSQSEIGSFTGHDSHHRQWGPAPPVESAQDYITAAQQQAPHPLHDVTSTLSNGSALGPDGLPLAAAAASEAAPLQHMDRSAPISMDLFGEESYEDPSLELPSQDAFARSEAGPLSGAAPNSPTQAAGAEPFSSSTAAPSSPSRATADTRFPAQTALTQFQPGNADFAVPSSSLYPQEDEDDFSPTWQEAEPGSPALGPMSLQAAPSTSEPADQHMSQPTFTAADWQNSSEFAATWPQPNHGGFPNLPQRQAISGPIPLDLFDMEETVDAPLVFAPHRLAPVVSSATEAHQEAPAASELLATSAPTAFATSSFEATPPGTSARPTVSFDTEGTDHSSSFPTAASDIVHGSEAQTDPQGSGHQIAPARQASPGPVSLEIFGIEEREDEPLQLPLQTAITVLQVPVTQNSGDGLQSVEEEAASQFWSTQTHLMQACAAELTRAHHVWSRVLASDTADAFQQDPNGALYLQALQQVWLIALLLQAAAELHQIDEQRAPRWHHAFAEASRQSLAKITESVEDDGNQSLGSVMSASQTQQQVQDIADQAHDWMKQQQPAEALESGNGSLPYSMQHEQLCKLSLLPLDTVKLPVVEPLPGIYCLASMEALWTHRVGKPLPQT